ncbi:type II toxin-antitoxin system VapC family toxin [Acidithiobacillus sp. IBUN Pt1247-S3]|uniref:type II toxin-antitoxin system VapC family toxin n=1 Tax=Acidithiobacillus sp. IBUN Pt1247-S3 TaxID=3166642 RepID=UPI0034E45703
MNGVLVDTSVWVDHFRNRNNALIELLELDLAMIHPVIIGEIACGTPPYRKKTLADLQTLQPSQQASVHEVIDFIEREQLFGQGCGLIDLQLLASTLMTPDIVLWTLDKRLSTLAERFAINYSPVHH